MQARLDEQPLGLSATATHDTKRGEDARARLYALSEMPEEWAAAVAALARDARNGIAREIDGAPRARAGDRVAVLPGAGRRLARRACAGRSGGRRGARGAHGRLHAESPCARRSSSTSWTVPAEDYEAAVAAFVRAALRDTAASSPIFIARTAPLRLAGASIRSRSSRSSSPRPACPTSIRARSSGISASSIPTTAARSILNSRLRAFDDAEASPEDWLRLAVGTHQAAPAQRGPRLPP